ncbi:hypothetical protein VTO42DRAFT_24 [Malbranchea cinnamomea]
MNGIPQIQIREWNSQQTSNDSSLVTEPYHLRPDLHPHNTTLPDIRSGNDPGTYLPATISRESRRPFWSRIRRSKSDILRPRSGDSSRHVSTPKPAIQGAKLVWCPERQIWIFPREDFTLEGSQKRTKKKWRPVSANWLHQLSSPLSSRNKHEDVVGETRDNNDLGWASYAELPGHHSPSVFDSSGNGVCQRSCPSLTNLTNTTTEESTEASGRGWMSVAARLSAHQPSR